MVNQIEISQIIRAAVSPTDLLRPKGKFQMIPLDFNTSNIFKMVGSLFIVNGEGFRFQLSVDDTGLYIERNSESCILTPDLLSDKKLRFFIATWSPNNLRLVTKDAQGNIIDLVKKTIPCSIPLSLKRWARDTSLMPVKLYDTEEDFRNAVYQCLSDLHFKIEDSGSGESFWDYLYDGNKIKNRTPKKESLAQPLMKAFIDTELYLRGIDIFRENSTLSGDIDFTVVGSVKNIGVVNMSIELKNAHSDKLGNGLLNQLPDYMRSQNSQYGAYCVLNYNINKETNVERADLIAKLNLMQIKSNDDLVRTKIRVFVIDLDKDIVAAKMK